VVAVFVSVVLVLVADVEVAVVVLVSAAVELETVPVNDVSVALVKVAVSVVDVSVSVCRVQTRSPPSLPSYAPLVPHASTNPFAAPAELYPTLQPGVQTSPESRGAHDE
jgi:hypothetical protein